MLNNMTKNDRNTSQYLPLLEVVRFSCSAV